MSPETVDSVITGLITGGLVLAGLAALAALPWRRVEVEAAHRAGGEVARGAVLAVARLVSGAPAPVPPRLVPARGRGRLAA